MPLDDRELWACALAVARRHGAQAPVYIATRIGALVLEDNSAGVDAWKAIAARLDQLHRHSVH